MRVLSSLRNLFLEPARRTSGLYFAGAAVGSLFPLAVVYHTALDRISVKPSFTSALVVPDDPDLFFIGAPCIVAAYLWGAAFGRRFARSLSLPQVAAVGVYVALLSALSGTWLLASLTDLRHPAELLKAPFLALFPTLSTSFSTVPLGIVAALLLRARLIDLRGLFLLAAATLALSFFVFTCFTYSLISADTPRISASRPIGSRCSANDSASIKRAASHPLVHGGVWADKSTVNFDRTRMLQANELEFDNKHYIVGYVRFDTAGELRMRSYDDLYGAVYCGWSPAPLKLPKREEQSSAFVKFDQCWVGHDGAEPVQEVCWFPEGQAEGTIVFSSAFRKARSAQRDVTNLVTE